MQHSVERTFSVFYGLDYAFESVEETVHAASTVEERAGLNNRWLVSSLADLNRIPTTYNPDAIVQQYSRFFVSSAVNVHSVVSVVFLIRRVFDAPLRRRRGARRGRR